MEFAYLTDELIHDFIISALAEDIGEGDHTTKASIAPDSRSQAQLLIKEEGIIAGLTLTQKIFYEVDAGLDVAFYVTDGAYVRKGDVAFRVQGNTRAILMAERLVLNCLQRMSGIATYTHRLNALIKGTGAKLLDTRKTTPNFRAMEKWAVAIGGGQNHRFGLYDMIILKDNHIDFAGGIGHAIRKTQQYLKDCDLDLKLEVEVRDLREVEEVLRTGGVDVIMLDNMSPAIMKEAVAMIDHAFLTEASGGITEKNIVDVAMCGVDFISVGALTHSHKCLDMSMKAL